MLDLSNLFPSLCSDTGIDIIRGVEPKLPMQDWVGALFTVESKYSMGYRINFGGGSKQCLRIVTDHITRL